MLEAFDFMLLRYSHCLFDFDGTVADTGDGITRSVAYSLEKMGYPRCRKPRCPASSVRRCMTVTRNTVV
jgi:phosphoglycolate phosphatase-like HAD superfamily hydrolase